MTGTVALNDFVLRHTEESRFSHYDGPLEEVVKLARVHMKDGRQGYREGVIEVDVPPEGFFSSVVQLREGDEFTGKYEARREGEAPRRHVGVKGGQKMPAKAVTLILYAYDVLAEDDDNSTNADWELISINARPTEEPEPIKVGTLMANHFGLDGGTDTQMTDSEFVEALRVSHAYWADKSMIAEEG